jgi:hypothetical protein
MPVDHERIEQLLDGDRHRADTSLRAKSLQRALLADVPRTLTPHEWEQWYEQHGVPASHLPVARQRKLTWWRRLLGHRP